MNTIKVMSVFGTRPEAIKMAPLVKKLEQTQGIESIVCVTAQHREMLDQVLEIFDLHPQYDLNIMQPRQTLATITTKALNGLSEVMQQEKPDLVLVHGDTTTTFADTSSQIEINGTTYNTGTVDFDEDILVEKYKKALYENRRMRW